jgi:hypothetical protein
VATVRSQPPPPPPPQQGKGSAPLRPHSPAQVAEEAEAQAEPPVAASQGSAPALAPGSSQDSASASAAHVAEEGVPPGAGTPKRAGGQAAAAVDAVCVCAWRHVEQSMHKVLVAERPS